MHNGRLGQALRGPVVLLMVAGAFAVLAPNAYQLAVGVNVGVAAIAVMGLSMAVGGAGQLHLGQAGFMAIGAYTVAMLTKDEGLLPFPLALLAGVALASACGLVVGYIALRLQGNYLAMATLALSMIVYALLLIDGPLGGPSGLAAIPAPAFFGLGVQDPIGQFALVSACVVLCYVLAQLIRLSRMGRELRALRDNEVAARVSGVNITRRKIQIFTVAAAFAGLAGGLLASIQSAIDPASFGLSISIQLLVMAVIGGLGHPAGAVLGAVLLQGIIQVVPSAGDWALTIVGVVVIVMMAIAPQGLSGATTSLARLVTRRERVGSPALTKESES